MYSYLPTVLIRRNAVSLKSILVSLGRLPKAKLLVKNLISSESYNENEMSLVTMTSTTRKFIRNQY